MGSCSPNGIQSTMMESLRGMMHCCSKWDHPDSVCMFRSKYGNTPAQYRLHIQASFRLACISSPPSFSHTQYRRAPLPSHILPHLGVVHDDDRHAAVQHRILKARRPAITRQCQAELAAQQQRAVIPRGVTPVAVPHIELALPVLLLSHLVYRLADTSAAEIGSAVVLFLSTGLVCPLDSMQGTLGSMDSYPCPHFSPPAVYAFGVVPCPPHISPAGKTGELMSQGRGNMQPIAAAYIPQPVGQHRLPTPTVALMASCTCVLLSVYCYPLSPEEKQDVPLLLQAPHVDRPLVVRGLLEAGDEQVLTGGEVVGGGGKEAL